MDELGLREIEIVATPVNNFGALVAKKRVIKQAESSPEVMRVVDRFLKQDQKRIDAAG